MSVCRILFVSIVILLLHPTLLLAAHGVSIDGKLKYPPDFSHFDYVSVEAQKGGKLLLHDNGSFDKMNPFTLKGTAPFGLDVFVFETLAVGSLDEPFAEYGLIASDIEVAEDKMSVIYTINPKAKFSDGSAITPEDVAFSLDTLKSDKVHPSYQYYYQDIQGAKVLDRQRVQFFFKRPNRELHMVASQIPVMSKSFYTDHSFVGGDDSGHLVPPVGSGPYIVSNFVQGKSITYTKNPNYWGENHPVQKGMYNFETITVNYYKDQIVAVEAFKAGEFDFMPVNIAKQWARDMKGKRFDDGTLLKKRFPHQNNAGMQGFLMNTRRKIFSDVRVRQALGLALDFKWTNNSLFYDQYTRCDSFFSNSYLAATGLPEGLELTYLEPFRESLPKEVFTTELHAPTYEGKGGMRNNLRKALKLLAAAGWKIKDGQLKDAKDNVFQFEILLVSQSFERVMAPYVANLKKLGMQVDYRTIDPALYTDRVQNFDFDMIVHVYGQSLSPGNEQKNYWHSEAANRQGSKNLAGIQDPVVDNLVEKIIYAKNQEELTAACKALDRVLWYGYYMVPNWYLNVHRIAFHKKFARPETLPLYYQPIQLLMTWWMAEAQNSDPK
jgi:microcin C transport system substrate-binding protein